MNLNEDKLDEITGKLIKRNGLDNPSSIFTEQVMQSVFAVKAPTVEKHKIHYLWFLFAIPAVIAGGLYLSAFPVILNKSKKIFDSIELYFNSFFSGLLDSYHQLANISLSPMLLIGSLAILFLLIIEAVLTRKKYQF